MTEKITNSDFYFAVACFVQGSVLLSTYGLFGTKQETWLVTAAGFIISLFIMMLYAALSKRFARLSLYDILPRVYGNLPGKILVLAYTLFFLLIASFELRDTGDFSIVYILPEMSLFVMISIFTLVCFFAVQSGIHNLLRYGFLLFLITGIVMIINTILLLDRLDFENFLPLFTQNFRDYFQGTHFTVAHSFCEVIVFLTIVPFLSEPHKIKRGYITGLVLGFIMFITVVVCEIAVLGSTAYILTSPYYETIRLINTFDVLTRLETLFAFMLIIMKFFKISLIYYAVSFGISKLLKTKMNMYINALTGVILTTCALLMVGSGMELRDIGNSFYPFILSFFEILLPLVTLGIAVLRKTKST